MGIQGFLPQLKSIMTPIHIKQLEGSFVAVDTYSWLHKGALSCSFELCKGLPTSRHINYCMHRVNLLRHYGVKPILVFDGGLLPMKSEQENKRARVRKENLARAIEHESSGNSTAAFECYQKAVDISPAIACQLIQVLKQENISYIVAPYEADAQMTFLAVNKLVEAVITEDSDLIPFGCPRIIFKMDKYGNGVEFQLPMLQRNKELSFTGFTKQMVLEMCILSGCDYLQSLPGMGLKRAHALIQKFKTFDKVIKHLRYSTVAVPPLYEESFKKAVWTFLHQRVYDPTTEDIVHLTTISDDIDGDLEFLGPKMPQHVVKAIATGEIDPITKQPFQEKNICFLPVVDRSHQLKDFGPGSDKKKLDLPAQKNLLTNYFCFASLEAKRKFRAPRASPKHPDVSDESSPSSAEQGSNEAGASKRASLSAPELGIFDAGDTLHPNSSTDDGFSCGDACVSNSPSGSAEETDPLPPFEHSIHKPCSVLHKERGHKNASSTVSETTRSEERRDVNVRNSYFKHKSKDETKLTHVNKRVTVKSSYFTLEKNDENATHGKSDKVVVRSSYFRRKSIANNNTDGKENERLDNNDAFSDDLRCENRVLENASDGTSCFEVSNLKRKKSPLDDVFVDRVESKHARVEASGPSKGDSPGAGAFPEVKSEGEKFGCNISHLGHYSDVSEKSMEKFVSVISSFRYTSSSGSRASGLRAPLRDVRNTLRSNGSSAVKDINSFAYKRTEGARRRR